MIWVKIFLSVIAAGWVLRAIYMFGLGVYTAWTCNYWDWWFWKAVIWAMLIPGMLPPGYSN